MSEMIAYCGLDCGKCDAFRATQTKDSERKRQLAERWNKGMNAEFRPEDINCCGCILTQFLGGAAKSAKYGPALKIGK